MMNGYEYTGMNAILAGSFRAAIYCRLSKDDDLDGESAKVVVQTEGLDAAQAAAIKDVILGEVSVPAENIRIFEVK